MPPSPEPLAPLTRDAVEIWRAGVDAVDSSQLVSQHVSAWRGGLLLAGHPWCARPESRIRVVGAGKAGAGMAVGLERSLGPDWLPKTSGWINVPEDCVHALERIHLHGARPAGVNEPTKAGVEGTQEILRQVQSLHPEDLCIVLISGGGSALLPAPISGITLEDKQQITRTLMRLGATIDELNCVRRALSDVKGGGLLRASRAGLTVTLIISDVIGDPIETIASGPTVPMSPNPAAALEVVKRFSKLKDAVIPPAVLQVLSQRTTEAMKEIEVFSRYSNHVIGNNRTAVEAAARHAQRLGYAIALREWDRAGMAAEAGRRFAKDMLAQPEMGRQCLISGGETTVQLAATTGSQKGGRNQEFALAAVEQWMQKVNRGVALVSGGTDGEDGPTDAAGAVVDLDLLSRVRSSELDPDEFLQVNNSYPFFEQVGGLLKTGPTHTNVMDLRVGLVENVPRT